MKLFGCIGFLLNGNMLVGVWKESLIARLGPDEGNEALSFRGATDDEGARVRARVLEERFGCDSGGRAHCGAPADRVPTIPRLRCSVGFGTNSS